MTKRFTRITALLLSLLLMLSISSFAVLADESSEAATTTEDNGLFEPFESAVEESAEESVETSEEASEAESAEDSKEESKEEASKDEASKEESKETSGETSETSGETSEEDQTANDSRDGGFPWSLVIFLAVIVIIVIVCFVCIKLQNKFGLWLQKFWRDYKSELGKIVWLSREVTFKKTGFVIVCLAICAIAVGLLDFGLAKLIQLLINLVS